jgi:hypothetical protein
MMRDVTASVVKLLLIFARTRQLQRRYVSRYTRVSMGCAVLWRKRHKKFELRRGAGVVLLGGYAGGSPAWF